MAPAKAPRPLWALPDGLTKPPPLPKAAFYGLAGEIVRALEPYSEADPTALLMTVLIGFGSAVGPGPAFHVGDTRHGLNLYGAIVGPTGTAAKGTSLADGTSVLVRADPEWKKRFLDGVPSGEGIIHQVRDPMARPGKDDSLIVTDPGVEDKRLFIAETEMASLFAKMSGTGNTISTVLRKAWDCSYQLKSPSKHFPELATGAHISVLGHISPEELRTSLPASELSNGFANRFLYVFTEGSGKEIPEPDKLPEQVLNPLVDKVEAALAFARAVQDIKRNEAARRQWRHVYHFLKNHRQPSLLGKITARSIPQVARVSGLCALMNGSAVVTPDHLKVALYLYRHSEAAAAYIYRDSLGDPLAEKLLQLLRAAGSTGTTKTELDGSGHRRKDTRAALAYLEERGLARMDKEPTRGRSAQRWWAT